MFKTLVPIVVILTAGLTAVHGSDPILPPEAGLPVIDWKDARKHLGETVVVQGKIISTRNIGRICFLNFDDPSIRTFTAIVRQSNYANFPKPPEEAYRDRWVRIRGMMREYRGKMQVEIVKPDQVTVLDAEPPHPLAVEPKRFVFTGTLNIGTYNILNLFDEYDDPYHTDEGTPAKPKDQLEHLAAAIRAAGADVLALEEVENRGYLERFVRTMLPDMGYSHIVCIESNDRRGIDCAVLSRLPVGPVTSYRHVRFNDGSGGKTRFRRDLLEVRIEPDGYESFTMFVVHLKSKRGGAATTLVVREAETRKMRDILDTRLSADAKARFLICGDFNDTWDSQPVRILRGDGPTALIGFVNDLPKEAVSFNRKPHRAMIDFILCSPEFARRYQSGSYHVPQGTVETTGSDHNPVLATFTLKQTR
ncbi:MAG: endonuclease/exonuclease/phosphatase family protein [Phycisphaerae bacterium]